MLRMMVETCTDRINWLIEDIGYRTDKPATKTLWVAPAAIDHLHTELYNEYHTRTDMRDLKHKFDSQSNTMDPHPTTGTDSTTLAGRPDPGANSNPPTPPLSPAAPT